MIAAHQRALLSLLEEAVERARRSRELSIAAADVPQTAAFILGALQGVRVMAKIDPGSAGLRHIVDRTVAAVCGPPQP
jgi:hypothetical protein